MHRCDLLLQAVNVEAERLKQQVEKLEGNIASLNEQLEAAHKESKTLKADSKTSAALESSIKKEQARAEVLFAPQAPTGVCTSRQQRTNYECTLRVS